MYYGDPTGTGTESLKNGVAVVRFLRGTLFYAVRLGIRDLRVKCAVRFMRSTLYSQHSALNRTTLYFPYDLTLLLRRSTLAQYA